MADPGYTPSDRVTGVVLAAGLGRRMGRPKALLPWAGGTLLSHAAGILRKAGIDSLAVVGADLVGPVGPIRTVVNTHPEQGLSTSLATAVGWLMKTAPGQAAMICLVDQPFVTVDDIRRMVRAYAARPPAVRIVRPWYHDRPGHPVVLHPDVFPDILALTGDVGIGRMATARDDVLNVVIEVGERPDPGFDIDTEEDYAQALAWAGS
ncbi:MAG: nucleotidyltransferase family protein [Thermaerobacter sp.]|nr:nucleotidyltransferase family protein [Thermaerobacter sp.]